MTTEPTGLSQDQLRAAKAWVAAEAKAAAWAAAARRVAIALQSEARLRAQAWAAKAQVLGTEVLTSEGQAKQDKWTAMEKARATEAAWQAMANAWGAAVMAARRLEAAALEEEAQAARP